MRLGGSAAATDPGRRRRHNEDSYVCEPPLFAVADGIGGAQAGEVASGLAAAAVRDDPGDGDGDARGRVHALVQEANRRVYERQAADAAVSGMGTTMTAALVQDDHVWIGHVGDSRAYRIRDGRLEQLTEDHSLVAELVRTGKLSPEEADSHPQRSIVTRALGTDPEVEVDTFQVEAKPGDLFLLCSDGLTTMVDDATILREIEPNRDDLQAAVKALVQAANRGGGEDNITVVCFEIAGDDDGRTVSLPPEQEGATADSDDAETLDEIDRVPVVEAAEPEPRRKEAHPVRRRALLSGAALIAVILACGFAVWGLWYSHFVGAEPDGHVAVYQGIPWNVAGNLHLYRAVYVSPLLDVQLSATERQKLFDHSLRSKSSAFAAVRRYEQQIGP
ncbi:MAG TPA: Stp1/IreP family PP2C-type Ser/Thr phosphatase [Gaiellaceae bacterium]|nr:Stp1/IreP family PP2C-type Ser/Thr phosphatase [Gaiellaceae bacterium]